MPIPRLTPYIKYFAVSENECAGAYKVLPSTGLVMGIQYSGSLSTFDGSKESALDAAGITGMTDSYKIFRNSAGIGTILVYFTEVGFTHFATHPAHELFNLSLSLRDVFDRESIGQVQEKLASAQTDVHRIRIVEQFLVSKLRDTTSDGLVAEAVRLISQSNGAIRIHDLNRMLGISQSSLEKRFRRIVGTSPKKFASIVRFNTVLDSLAQCESLTDLGYKHHFFDQAHFIKDFKQFSGDTPEQFRRSL